LEEIDVIPRRVAKLNYVLQINIAISHRAIVHWESPTRNQVTAVYLVSQDADRDVSGNHTLYNRLMEIKSMPSAFPTSQDGHSFGYRETGKKGVAYARHLYPHKISQIL
jgi:hypothetical protein